jgi:ornithine cyclodeaminase/alanine dehydrogenase-like protein (mu-crystallin family)
MSADVPAWISAEQVFGTVSFSDAVRAMERALEGGLDPARDAPRSSVPAGRGHLLLMPSSGSRYVGVKVASVAPGNTARGLDRIQAVYVLMDSDTLTPQALVAGTALTTLRTPALSAAVANRLAAPGAERLVVFGTGPQAWGHVNAVRAVRPLTDIAVVGRNPHHLESLLARLSAEGVAARQGDVSALGEADIVVCATSADSPLFDSDVLADHVCVLAIGSHVADRREVDSGLMRRATVVVEDVPTALREAGDVVMAVDGGALEAGAVHGLRELFAGGFSPPPGRPTVFKGVGMAWQDLVIATEVFTRLR